MAYYACIFADKSWYWPTGHYYYYNVYHPFAPAARQITFPMPAAAVRDGRPLLNPAAQPFSPEEGPKPASPEVKVNPPFLPHQLLIPPSTVYFTPPPPPSVLPQPPPPSVLPQPPPQPPVRRTEKAMTLQGSGGKRVDFAPPPRVNDEDEIGVLNGKTSIMIRNLPNSFKREDLMRILDKHCRQENKKLRDEELAGSCRSEYDFVYLPIDFSTNGNKGYAFVNFTSADGAKRIWKAYQGYKWGKSPKICEICPAILQGKDALVRSLRYRAFPAEHYQPKMAKTLPRDGFNNARFVSVGFGRRSTYL